MKLLPNERVILLAFGNTRVVKFHVQLYYKNKVFVPKIYPNFGVGIRLYPHHAFSRGAAMFSFFVLGIYSIVFLVYYLACACDVFHGN
jgi:hypothetical protein